MSHARAGNGIVSESRRLGDGPNSRCPRRPAAATCVLRVWRCALSKKQWGQPELDWLPLSRAVFTFGVAEEGISDALHDKPLHELTEAEMAETHATSFSVRVLTRMLEEKTGARKAEINPTSCTFSFSFDIDGVASLMSGPPWAIIEEPRETAASFDPRLDAEALFNTEGFVRIGDEEAVSHAEQLDAVRKATGLVWRQFMLRAFDRAVSTGAVVLFARIQATSAPFERLPADVWPLLNVVDWQNGVAVAPDRTAYWSIHVRPRRADQAAAVSSATSRRPGRNRAGMAIAKIYPNGIPNSATEPNTIICRKVGNWLKDQGMPGVSDSTILRAAGRRD
jgi:hypothetical protein